MGGTSRPGRDSINIEVTNSLWESEINHANTGYYSWRNYRVTRDSRLAVVASWFSSWFIRFRAISESS